MPHKDPTVRQAYMKVWRELRRPKAPLKGEMIVGLTWKCYAAGLIDGEGCIGIRKRQRPQDRTPVYSPYVTVNMTARQVVEKMQLLFGGALNPKYNPKPNARVSWAWTLTGKNARKFLDQVQPFLLLKAAQAEAALWVLKSTAKDPNGKKLTPGILAQREICRQDCLRYNQRGTGHARIAV